jgi:serine/threonine protein kinase
VATISSIGKYQVLGTLGKGAHSTILHIRRNEDSREYALKLVTIDGKEETKFLEQAKHEFMIAQKLHHPNLIKIYALELKRNWLFTVNKVEMLIEYVNGKTLDAVAVPHDQFAFIFGQIASGLTHMHYRGIFHADMKPNNVLYGKRGEVKIIDYGLAWIKGEAKDRIQGTPEYIAPETAKKRIINERTDIYNFGATMYRITTMRFPPCAMATDDVIRVTSKTFKQMLTPVEELNKGVPKRLCALIHRCLAYEPEQRPERMRLVLDELKIIADEMGTPFSDTEF